MELETNIKRGDWTIWAWTGWKPRFSKAKNSDCDCYRCGKRIMAGELCRIEMTRSGALCAVCDGQPNLVYGQWLARNDKLDQFAYVSVPGGQGLYKRGETFDIQAKPNQAALLADSIPENLEFWRLHGLSRMESLIASFTTATPAPVSPGVANTGTSTSNGQGIIWSSTSGTAYGNLIISPSATQGDLYFGGSTTATRITTDLEKQLMAAIQTFGLKHKRDCPFEKCNCGVDDIVRLVAMELESK